MKRQIHLSSGRSVGSGSPFPDVWPFRHFAIDGKNLHQGLGITSPCVLHLIVPM